MKKINLKTTLKNLQGKAIPLSATNKNPITIKKVLLNLLGTFNTKIGDEAIRTYAVGIKINQAKDEIKLENAEFELVKKAVEQNKIYVAIVIAQVLKILE